MFKTLRIWFFKTLRFLFHYLFSHSSIDQKPGPKFCFLIGFNLFERFYIWNFDLVKRVDFHLLESLTLNQIIYAIYIRPNINYIKIYLQEVKFFNLQICFDKNLLSAYREILTWCFLSSKHSEWWHSKT